MSFRSSRNNAVFPQDYRNNRERQQHARDLHERANPAIAIVCSLHYLVNGFR
jgi:hypothetical protein